MLSDLLLPVLHNALRPVDGVQRGSFSPRGLFLAGEQGGWWDPSDFGSMFQDSAGTTPVTAVGQPVGKILDKSGRANHASQATAASRPTLQQDASGFYYLSFDGVDDSLATASIDFTSTDKVSVTAGLLKAVDTAFAIFCELSVSADVNNGALYMSAPLGAAGANVGVAMKGAGSIQSINSGAIHAAPASVVVSHAADLGAPSQTIRTNGVSRANSVVSAGVGPFGNYPFFIGRRGGASFPFTGRMYSLVVRGAVSTAVQIAQTERFVGAKMGIAL